VESNCQRQKINKETKAKTKKQETF
jgi:hypothetical protein